MEVRPNRMMRCENMCNTVVLQCFRKAGVKIRRGHKRQMDKLVKFGCLRLKSDRACSDYPAAERLGCAEKWSGAINIDRKYEEGDVLHCYVVSDGDGRTAC